MGTAAAPAPAAGYSLPQIAAALEALAGWIADALAGGKPSLKVVAMQAEAGASYIAGMARGDADHDDAGAVPAVLAADEPDSGFWGRVEADYAAVTR